MEITLNGIKFKIELGSYGKHDVSDYAPRASVPGGAVVYSELLTYQPIAQEDWQHGFGFQWHEDAAGYMKTNGNMDTRHSGIAMLFTNQVESDTDTKTKTGFTNFTNTYTMALTGGSMRALNNTTSTWADVADGGSGSNFQAQLATSEYLFHSPTNARLLKFDTSLTPTVAGVDANAKDFSWFCIHDGFVFAGVRNSNKVHYASETDLSDLHGNVGDTEEITIGGGNWPTIGAVSYAGTLYVSRYDGVWAVDDAKQARKVIDFSNEVSAENFASMVVYNGYLIFPVQDRLYQWNGSRMTRISAPKVTDTYPYVTYGRYKHLLAKGDYLYMIARTITDATASTYDEDLLCYDGVGFHKLCKIISGNDGITGADGTVTGMGYDSYTNKLYIHVHSTLVNSTYVIPFSTRSEFPYASFPTTGTHSIITSRWDAGFRRVQKSMTSLEVSASNVTAARYITVKYALNGGSYVTWGNITTNGITKLTLPGGLDTVEFYYIQFAFEFVTDSATQTPILDQACMRFIMRPDEVWGFSFDIVVCKEYEEGLFQDNRTGSEIITQLQTLRASKSPVEFVDILGDTYTVYVTAVRERAVEYHSNDALGKPDIEYIATVSLTEAV